MKIPLRTNKYVVIAIGLAVCAVAVSCAEQQRTARRGNVEISEGLILIHPAIKLSPEDEKAMEKILGSYDTRLYKIERFENGKVIKTQGKLPDTDPENGRVLVSAEFRAELVAAHSNKGKDVLDKQVTCPQPCVIDKVPVPADEKKKFVRKLAPILEKY
jgi:hypothetical protein